MRVSQSSLHTEHSVKDREQSTCTTRPSISPDESSVCRPSYNSGVNNLKAADRSNVTVEYAPLTTVSHSTLQDEVDDNVAAVISERSMFQGPSAQENHPPLLQKPLPALPGHRPVKSHQDESSKQGAGCRYTRTAQGNISTGEPGCATNCNKGNLIN